MSGTTLRVFLRPSLVALLAVLLFSGVAPAVAPVAAASPATDRESLWTQRCLAWERVLTPNRACVYGDTSSRVVVALVGDSHASHLFPAIDRIAKAHHWKLVVMVKVSCGFVDIRIRNIALGREYRECATWNRNVLSRLSVLRPARTIVAMSRRAVHAIRSIDASSGAKGRSLARMIRQVPGPVTVIVDSPFARINVPVCIARRGAASCAIPKATALSVGLGSIERTAAASSGASLVDLTRATCAAWPCPVVVRRMTVFRDEEHFTATYSRTVLGSPGGVLDKALVAHLR